MKKTLKEFDKEARLYLIENKGYSATDESSVVISCSKCGEILKYKSISYNEGYHIDGCDL